MFMSIKTRNLLNKQKLLINVTLHKYNKLLFKI